MESRMASQPEKYLNASHDENDSPAVLAIGRFTLEKGAQSGKIRMTSPSGETTEVDDKVLEDLLASFF